MTGSNPTSGIPSSLLRWVETTLGGKVLSCERIAGGASRLSYSLTLNESAKAEKAFLRVDSGQGPLSETGFTLERETRAVAALAGTAVRVPKIYAYNAEHKAVLMETIVGTADFFSVRDPERATTLQENLLRQLAELHRLPIDFKSVFGEDSPTTAGDALRAEVLLWGDLYRRHVAVPEPLISFALDWLLRTIPLATRAVVLVHGDIGPGNFLFHGTSISALIDWEITHPGHPLEDLACIIARSLGVPFGDLRQHVLTYGQLTGAPVDPWELDYCVVLVLTRFCIGISMGIAKPSLAVDIPILVKFLQVNLFALGQLLARIHDLPRQAPRTLGLVPATTHPLFDYTIDVLQQQVQPAVSEGYVAARVAGLQGMLAYLRNVSDYGSDRLRAEELVALKNLLHAEMTSVEEGRQALANTLAHTSNEQRLAILTWLVERTALEEALMKDTLGPMYGRLLDY